VNSALKILLFKDKQFLNWRSSRRLARRDGTRCKKRQRMIQNSSIRKNFVAWLAGGGYGDALYFGHRFPDEKCLPSSGHGSAVAVNLLISSNTLTRSSLLDPLHRLFHSALRRLHFTLKAGPPGFTRADCLLPRALARETNSFLVLGRFTILASRIPAENPTVARHPGKRSFHRHRILGAIGTGKQACCMNPYADQILGYRASR